MQWLADNWALIALVLYIVSQVGQVLTKHFSEYKGIAKLGAVLIDLPQVVPSPGSPGKLKLPLTPSKKPEAVQ